MPKKAFRSLPFCSDHLEVISDKRPSILFFTLVHTLIGVSFIVIGQVVQYIWSSGSVSMISSMSLFGLFVVIFFKSTVEFIEKRADVIDRENYPED